MGRAERLTESHLDVLAVAVCDHRCDNIAHAHDAQASERHVSCASTTFALPLATQLTALVGL